MRLPNGEAAIVDIEKLRDYCLSSEHPRGRHKARVFQSRLMMGPAHAEELLAALMDAARSQDAKPGASDEYGDRYIIDFEMKRGERKGTIRSCWILRTSENAPRFVTCYVR